MSLTPSWTCADLRCEHDNSCCAQRDGISYCQVSSYCKSDPIWQSIVIPAVLFTLAVVLIVIACVKLRNYRKETMKVNNFARHQIRMMPKMSEGRMPTTLTSIAAPL